MTDSSDDPTTFQATGGRRRLGHYSLIRRLGRGGMGEVFLATDERLKRSVALKVLRVDREQTADLRLRFEREAAAVSRLEHPGIVPIYEMAEDAGIHYFVMRYVDGVALSTYVASARRRSGLGAEDVSLVTGRPLGEAETVVGPGGRSRARVDGAVTASVARDLTPVLEIIERTAEALHFAHEHGVIHRDVKPSNIMIDRDGRPQLLDFGLARFVGAETQTSADALLGTLPYMAPEQVTGSAKVDRRVDVWSLGVTLYECVAGTRPFQAENAEALMFQIVMKDPPSPRLVDESLAKDLETIVMTCLEKDPNRRYPTSAALAGDLARLRRHRQIEAKSVGRIGRAVRHAERHPVQTTLAALLVVGVFAIGAVLLAQWREHRRLAPYRHFVAEARRLEGARDVAARELAEAQASADAVEKKTAPFLAAETPEKAALFAARRRVKEAEVKIAELNAAIEYALLRSREPAEPPRDGDDRNEIYFKFYLEAEATGDLRKAALYRTLLEDSAFADRLEARGALDLATDPPGADALAVPLREGPGGRLVPDETRAIRLGKTPIGRNSLPAGSWIVRLEAADRAAVVYPIVIERDETWGDAPRWHGGIFATKSWLVRLPKKDAFDPNEWCFVPAGPYRAARDRSYRGRAPEHDWRWEDDFVIAKRETTIAAYGEFLTAAPEVENLLEGFFKSGPDRQLPQLFFVPRLTEYSAPLLDIAALLDQRRLEPAPTADGVLCEFDPQAALGSISPKDAGTYLRWLGATKKLELSLPTASQWEKAARGVDGRIYPWGSTFDWSFTNGRFSRPPTGNETNPLYGKFARRPGEMAADLSVYGVLDMGGNVAEFTADGKEGAPDTHWIVGGACGWDSEMFTMWPVVSVPYDYVTVNLGFRTVLR